MRLSHLAVLASSIAGPAAAFAQQNAPPPAFPPPAPPMVDATPLDVRDARITAVTMYTGRAAVTRTASLNLQPGAYDLRFTNLPESIQPDSIQARTADGLRVLGVEFVQAAAPEASAASPEVAALDQQVADLTASLREIADKLELVKSQEGFLAALNIRASSDAAQASGTPKLDLDALRQQMEFMTSERQRLQGERRALETQQQQAEKQLAAAKANRDAAAGRAGATRSAVVGVVAPEAFEGEIALTYLVAAATWQATYNLRAAGDLSSTQIEYDALLTQRTGEDWNDVRLTLSTAQPTVAANPPVLQPWYVDVWRPQQNQGLAESRSLDGSGRQLGTAEPARRAASSPVDKADMLADLAADASVAGLGPAVTFELPRAVTVKTNAQQQQRTRIGTIDSGSQFVHVAVPILTEAVYLRGDLANRSAFQLLPGRASIFMGQDYIGPTAMPSVAPGGLFQMYFGIDHAVKVKRQLISKNTENTGLLSGGRRTSYEYHIAIDNGTGREITLELWDRMPVSRSEDIQVQLVSVNPRLANDAYYTAEQQPQGLLKWWLTIPASSRDRSAAMVNWSLRIDRAKDVQMTGLPE